MFGKAQAKVNWDLFDKNEVEETLTARSVHKAGSDLYAPLHETWKDLPLTHTSVEDNMGFHAPDFVLKHE
eukprot:5197518-Karenia_brevis.AAC.1